MTDPSHSATFDLSEPLLSQGALAAWLGVSPATVKKWTRAGPAPGRVPRFYKVNGRVRIRRIDVQT